jgi:hypothetical protein
MKVVDAILDGVGRRTGDFDRAWCTLNVFIDDGTGHNGGVEIECVIARTPSTTWADMEADARGQAIAYMKAALAALEADDVATIRTRAKEAADKESAELAKAFSQ